MTPHNDRTQADQESLLLERIQQARRQPKDRGAVIIHFSRLRSHNRREHHMRIALDVFESRVKDLNGQIFALSNRDLVFVWRGSEIGPIDDAVQHVCQLFSDDPLSHVGGTDDQLRFCSWYKIDSDGAALQDTIEKVLAARENPGPDHPKRSTDQRLPLTPSMLESLEKSLTQADLSNMMRRQSICVLTPGQKPETVLRELYISIADLAGSLPGNVDLTGDPWLFQRLTMTLDRRMLALMERQDDSSIARYYSMNINVTTLLHPAFLKFDAGVRSDARGTIALEIPLIDIFRDIASFRFARDFARARGYRICADGVSQYMVPFVDRDALDLDLLKIHWTPDMLDDPTGKRRQAMVDCLEHCGSDRLILCRCDSQEAVDYGMAMGIAMFQGRGVDAIVSSGAAVPASPPGGVAASRKTKSA